MKAILLDLYIKEMGMKAALVDLFAGKLEITAALPLIIGCCGNLLIVMSIARVLVAAAAWLYRRKLGGAKLEHIK